MTKLEVLEEVKRRILAEPGSYDQRHVCESPCCIAGHVDIIRFGQEAHATKSGSRILSEGARFLTGSPSMPWLFEYPEEWRHPQLTAKWEMASTPYARAMVACEVIDTFIDEERLDRGARLRRGLLWLGALGATTFWLWMVWSLYAGGQLTLTQALICVGLIAAGWWKATV